MTTKDGFARHVFLSEIEFQARLATRAAERLTASVDDLDSLEIWSAIQSILVSAGNVSKILWPSRKSSAARGAMLRELLGIADDSPLSNRTFRNHFEHYDERIEDWLSTRNSAGYVDQLVGSPTRFLGGFPELIHRSYDPSTQTLSYRGESTNLKPVLLALSQIQLKCRSITHV
jgi:hypothetical protein